MSESGELTPEFLGELQDLRSETMQQLHMQTVALFGNAAELTQLSAKLQEFPESVCVLNEGDVRVILAAMGVARLVMLAGVYDWQWERMKEMGRTDGSV